jgi:hypothetical protein
VGRRHGRRLRPASGIPRACRRRRRETRLARRGGDSSARRPAATALVALVSMSETGDALPLETCVRRRAVRIAALCVAACVRQRHCPTPTSCPGPATASRSEQPVRRVVVQLKPCRRFQRRGSGRHRSKRLTATAQVRGPPARPSPSTRIDAKRAKTGHRAVRATACRARRQGRSLGSEHLAASSSHRGCGTLRRAH